MGTNYFQIGRVLIDDIRYGTKDLLVRHKRTLISDLIKNFISFFYKVKRKVKKSFEINIDT